MKAKMAELGTKMKTASDNTKKQAEATMARAGEAMANVKIVPKKEDEPISDLLEVLLILFEIDPRARKPHEMVEALEIQGIKTWRGFLLMAEEDIPLLTKSSVEGEVPLSYNSIRMLTYLKQFTLHNINTGVENAKDPTIYTREAFDGFVEDLQLGRRSALGREEETEKKTNKERLDNMRASLTGFASTQSASIKGFASNQSANIKGFASNQSANIKGLASNLKPTFNNEEGSINDILQKTKSKVFSRNKDSKDAPPVVTDEDTESSSEIVAHNDSALDSMRKSVDDLASKLEMTAKTAKTKEEVQKLMVPLLSKLKVSQDKFANMVEARKKKKEDGGEEAPVEGEEGSSSTTNNQKLKNLLSSAENATKRAFENAEKAARQAAKKAGILDNEEKKEESSVPAQNGCQPEETV